MTARAAAHADQLRSLHKPGDPLILPNAWDAATSRWVADAGFPVIATSSWAVAAGLGYADGEQVPVPELFAVTRRISSTVDLPVTMDCESGYGLAADELVALLLESGAVGLNIEDTDHVNGGLRDAAEQAERVAAIRAAGRDAGVELVINARVDVFHEHPEPTAETVAEAIRRARAYRAAGADCVYPIMLTDERVIGEFVEAVDAPVNVNIRPDTPPVSRLAELGVARISLATGLMRAAAKAVADLIEPLRRS